MTRWSLRRKGRRARGASAGPPDAYRPDPYAAAASAGMPTAPEGMPASPEGPSAAPAAMAIAAPADADPGADSGAARSDSAWPDICGQFGLHLLTLAEQLRISLDALESDEGDPERLQKLYQVDHAVTRMRRASLDLRTLAGHGEEDPTAPVTSLLDVIRMALSAIEHYADVTVAKVADLAVLGYAADDLGELMAALLDNATRYSPGSAAVSAHLIGDGSVLLRVEDSGIGIAPETVTDINAMLAGPVRELDSRTGLRTGFPVVHRVARKHGIAVRLAARPSPASGTIAMVTLPAHLLCEIPEPAGLAAEALALPRGGAGAAADSVTPLTAASRRARMPRASGAQTPRGTRARTPDAMPVPGQPEKPPDSAGAGLPHRERASLRAALGRERRPDAGPAAELSPEEQAAARRAFADDLTAFSLGSAETPESQESAGKGTAP